MKKILVIFIIFSLLSVNVFAIQKGYYKEKIIKNISSEISKSEGNLKKFIENGGTCGEKELFDNIIKLKEISINLIQKKVNDRYYGYNKQIKLFKDKEDKLYKELEKLKEDYEKADNLYDDFTARTGDYNYDLLRDSNYKYDLVDRKKKEIAKFIKEYSKYIDEFDKSDLEYFKDSTIIKKEIISGITEKCLEMKERIKPRKKSLTKNKKDSIKQEKTKLEKKQEKLKNKIIFLYKKYPKKIEAIYPIILKIKMKEKKGTDRYILIETIEQTIYELMSK